MKTILRIANAQAFWGDRTSAAVELLTQAADLDYLTMDYLAEVSMSILAQQRDRHPDLGYPRDFLQVIQRLAPYWRSGGRCKLIANAGGLNPHACASACAQVLQHAGCRALKIGVVQGDNILDLLLHATPEDRSFCNADDQTELDTVQNQLVTANAYLGAAGIVEALQAGADIVITGRVADPSMVVAPCIAEFGWNLHDWDRLAGATVAGHLLECGTQVTGGISTEWLQIPDPTHIGYPIAEIGNDGSCVVTKPNGTGGHVTIETVKEQLLYEIGNPARYVSPDVIVAFDQLSVEPLGPNRIRVSGAVGQPAPTTLKVSATYRDGYRAAGMLTIFGEQSARKAQRCGEIVLARLAESGYYFRDTSVECLGRGDSVPVAASSPETDNARETVLRIAVESDACDAVEQFCEELMPLITSGPPGTTGYAEGRPRAHAVFRYWPCLVDAGKVAHRVHYMTTDDTSSGPVQDAQGCWPIRRAVLRIDATKAGGDRRPDLSCEPAVDAQPGPTSHSSHHSTAGDATQPRTGQSSRTLAEIAYGRSGDKGVSANIGILARSPADYPWLVQRLTAQRVHEYFSALGVDSVERFELPNLLGLNFILRGVLRRGLRNDAQGKALAQALLAMPVPDYDLQD